MDSLNTHPSNALQAKAFTSPASLSFPGGAGDMTTPPSSLSDQSAYANGQQATGNGVTPATPVATPAAGQVQGVSGIVPTLQ